MFFAQPDLKIRGPNLNRIFLKRDVHSALWPSLALFCLCSLLWACDITSGDPPQDSMEQLKTLPYLQGTHKARENTSVTVNKTVSEDQAYNLYNSAHAAQAFLIDMGGNEVHRWARSFKEAFPGLPEATGEWYDQSHWRNYWRRVHLFPNGEMLALFEGNGLIKIRWDSQVIWAINDMFHHDMEVTADGRIFVLNRRLATFDKINDGEPILEDLITVLDKDGRALETYSVVKMLIDSEFADLIKHIPRMGDCFHTNTLEVLDGRWAAKSPVLKAGNVLLSMRMFDTIMIADLEARKIVWAQKPGIWAKQHQPTLIGNGHMLLFNNVLEEKETAGYDASSVIEFDPVTMQVVWEYKGTEAIPFFSNHSGSNQRLRNGHTLITESAPGRAFEVTPQGEIVWEFVNPHRSGKNKEYTATLLELIRISPQDYQPFFDHLALGEQKAHRAAN